MLKLESKLWSRARRFTEVSGAQRQMPHAPTAWAARANEV